MSHATESNPFVSFTLDDIRTLLKGQDEGTEMQIKLQYALEVGEQTETEAKEEAARQAEREMHAEANRELARRTVDLLRAVNASEDASVADSEGSAVKGLYRAALALVEQAYSLSAQKARAALDLTLNGPLDDNDEPMSLDQAAETAGQRKSRKANGTEEASDES